MRRVLELLVSTRRDESYRSQRYGERRVYFTCAFFKASNNVKYSSAFLGLWAPSSLLARGSRVPCDRKRTISSRNGPKSRVLLAKLTSIITRTTGSSISTINTPGSAKPRSRDHLQTLSKNRTSSFCLAVENSSRLKLNPLSLNHLVLSETAVHGVHICLTVTCIVSKLWRFRCPSLRWSALIGPLPTASLLKADPTGFSQLYPIQTCT